MSDAETNEDPNEQIAEQRSGGRGRRRGGRRRRGRGGPEHPGAVFLVDKPSGPTSHDIVRDVRRWTNLQRVGHGGTLDPLATGLLPIFVGMATRLNEYLGAYSKSYEATVLLGTATDTDDSEGEVISTAEVPTLTEAAIEAELARFRGTIEQTPPLFSAVKVGGVAAHRAARAGQPLEIEPRTVTIHELGLLSLDLPQLRLSMRVSTGTYVRAVARDLGAALGCGAHVTEMRRTQIGDLTTADAHTPEALAAAAQEERVWELANSPARLFGDWPSFTLSGEQLSRIRRGQPIRAQAGEGKRHALALNAAGSVIAVLRSDPLAPGRWEPEKVLQGT